jgi:hypothetical protein
MSKENHISSTLGFSRGKIVSGYDPANVKLGVTAIRDTLEAAGESIRAADNFEEPDVTMEVLDGMLKNPREFRMACRIFQWDDVTTSIVCASRQSSALF